MSSSFYFLTKLSSTLLCFNNGIQINIEINKAISNVCTKADTLIWTVQYDTEQTGKKKKMYINTHRNIGGV